MKRFVGCFLVLTLILSMAITVYGADIVGSKTGTGDVPVELTQEASNFSVTVPTVLPVDIAADGTVTVSTDNKIINNSYGPIEIREVSVIPQNDWNLVDFETDFKTKEVNLKEFGFQLNDTNVEVSGDCFTTFEVIPGNSEINFSYDANVATQKHALEDIEIAQVVFVVGWQNAVQGYNIIPLEDIIDENGIAQMAVGQSVDLEAVAFYSEDDSEWVSSDSSVLNITEDGLATALKAGTATITYTDSITGKSGSLDFNIIEMSTWSVYQANYQAPVTTYYWYKYNRDSKLQYTYRKYTLTNCKYTTISAKSNCSIGNHFAYSSVDLSTFSGTGGQYINLKTNPKGLVGLYTIAETATGEMLIRYYKSYIGQTVNSTIGDCQQYNITQYKLTSYTKSSSYTESKAYNSDLEGFSINSGITYYTEQYSSSTEYYKGDYISEVSSTNSSAYPSNSYKGSYWYVYKNSTTKDGYYYQGSYKNSVTAEKGTYPDNAYQDGYWYVLK